MSAPATLSLWSLWRRNRDHVRPFGEVCEMARTGRIPGAIPVEIGTPVIAADRADDAVAAMRRLR